MKKRLNAQQKQRQNKKYVRRFFKFLFRTVLFLVAALSITLFFLLQTIDPNQYKSTLEKQLSDVTGRAFKINGPIGWGIRNARPTIIMEQISLSNPDWAIEKNMLRVKKLSIQLSIRHLLLFQLKFGKILLDTPLIYLEKKSNTQASWLFETKGTQKSSKEYQQQIAQNLKTEAKMRGDFPLAIDLSIDKISFQNLSFHYHNRQANTVQKINMDSLSFELDMLGDKVHLNTQLIYQDQRYQISGTVGKFDEFNMQTKPYPYHLIIQTSNSFLRAKGVINDLENLDGMTLNLKGMSKNIRQDFKPFDIDMFYLPKTSFNIQLSGSKESINVDQFKINIANSDLSVRGILKMEPKKKPAFIGNIQSNLFDIPAMFEQDDPTEPNAKVVEKDDDDDQETNAFKDVPFPIDSFHLGNLDLTIKIKKLMAMDTMPIKNIFIKAALKDGKAILSPVSTDYANGKVDITILGDMSDKQTLKAEVSIEGKDLILGDIVEYSGGGRLFDNGRVNTSIYLKGSGPNLEQLMSSLDGTVKAYTTNKIKGYQLSEHLIGKDFLTTFIRTVIPQEKKKDIDVYCTVAHLKIADGFTESNRGIALETDAVNIVVDGRVNFKDETLDVSIVPIPVEGLRFSSGTVIEMMRIQGTLAHPKLVLSGEDVIDSATKIAVTTAFVTLISGGALTVATAGIGLVANTWLKTVGEDEHPCETAMKGTAAPRPEDNPNITPVEDDQFKLKSAAERQIDIISSESKSTLRKTRKLISGRLQRLFGTDKKEDKNPEDKDKK